jgi:hypothetical protein
MAESLSHKWGQILGDFIEELMRQKLEDIAQKYNLYLDYQKERKARKKKKKVSWQDKYGNYHDLDYVLEKNGTEDNLGEPVAFIESAWRGYTKHSKNKAQEIESAILPLADTYYKSQPFLGAILAGEFTQPSIQQLESKGFKVLYIPYNSVVQAFSKVGIDAAFNDKTHEENFSDKIDKFYKLSPENYQEIRQEILTLAQEGVDQFFQALEMILKRQICEIIVMVLHGKAHKTNNIHQATQYLQSYPENQPSQSSACKYEICLKYNNGDQINGSFHDKDSAIRFLANFS